MAKTIRGELVDLFKKWGGKESDLKGTETTAEMIDALEKVYHDDGDTLPAVTSDDNGKVLSVVNGEWDKANAPVPPSNEFIVTYTEGVGADKTFAEIAAAYEAGKNIKAKAVLDGADIWFTLLSYANAEGDGAISFINTIINSDVVDFMTITHTLSDGTEAITVDTASVARTSS